MEESHSSTSGSPWGTVTVSTPIERQLTSADSRTTLKVKHTLHVWDLLPSLTCDQDELYRLRINCLQGSDGVRRFCPEDGGWGLVVKGSLGGHVIRANESAMEGAQSQSYHVMRMIWQKAPYLQEHLCRTFRRKCDLHVTVPERPSQDVVHILPEHLGRMADSDSPGWSVAELMQHGRAAAVNAGQENPSEETCIRWGVFEAARRNPIDIDTLNEETAAGLIRTGLFDFGPAEQQPDQKTTDYVIERLLAAMEQHADDNTEEFDNWFFKNGSGLVHQIAKQRKAAGGPIERQVVRQVMVELVYQSFRYMGDCIHAQMKAFAEALPTPLTEQERVLFNLNYQKQPCLGGLPLVLLIDQFRPLREPILAIWNNPDDRSQWGVFLRVLEFHAEMLRNKRASERHYKRQRSPGSIRTVQSIETGAYPLAAADLENSHTVNDDFQEVAAVLRRRERSDCECPGAGEWEASLDTGQSTENELVFEDQCRCCGRRNLVRVSAEEARRIHASLGA